MNVETMCIFGWRGSIYMGCYGVCVMFVWGEFMCAVYRRYQVSCFILHLIPLRQGFLLNLQLAWQPASPSNPPHSAGALSDYASAGIQT